MCTPTGVESAPQAATPLRGLSVHLGSSLRSSSPRHSPHVHEGACCPYRAAVHAPTKEPFDLGQITKPEVSMYVGNSIMCL